MFVTMVFIGIVRVRVPRRLVHVFVNMRLVRICVMNMLMVAVIVNMGMGMFFWFVFMLVRMTFCNVEPNANGHQPPCQNKRNGNGVTQ